MTAIAAIGVVGVTGPLGIVARFASPTSAPVTSIAHLVPHRLPTSIGPADLGELTEAQRLSVRLAEERTRLASARVTAAGDAVQMALLAAKRAARLGDGAAAHQAARRAAGAAQLARINAAQASAAATSARTDAARQTAAGAQAAAGEVASVARSAQRLAHETIDRRQRALGQHAANLPKRLRGV